MKYIYSINILNFFIFIISIFLILIILVQNPKKEIVNQSFMENLKFFGVNKTNTILDNITWFLSIVIFLLVITLNFLLKN
ncbi:preprotein translocase subunit SecG [Blattabacterium cuenoti]|uniref:preprotein translocase subunit SecG n=1 Tax=Blattabacterium cuenoti TaxID=1653831 RepID=UPI00293BE887|nr:preprotein translocase subunit SecG [Blattabacterium cuenoti]